MAEDKSWLDRLDYALEEKRREHLSEVIDELAEEGVLYLPYTSDIADKNNLYHLFKSSKQTGLYDRLKKYLKFDIDAFNDENKSEKLCFIKYIYLIENDFPLIKILSNPTLADINIHNQLKQRNYDENLHNIALKIRSKLSDKRADKIDKCFYEIAEDWMGLSSEIFNMISDAYFQENQRKGSIRRAKNRELLNNISKKNQNVDIVAVAGAIIKNDIKRSQKKNYTSIREEIKKFVSNLYADEEPVEYDSFAGTLKNYSECIETVIATFKDLYYEMSKEIDKVEIHHVMEELDDVIVQFRETTNSFLNNKQLEQYDYYVSANPDILEYMQKLDELVEKVKSEYTRYIVELKKFNFQDINMLYSIQLNAVSNISLIIRTLISMTDTEKINKAINQSAAHSQSDSDKIDNIVQYLCDSFSEFKNKIETDEITNIGYRNGVFESFYNLFHRYYVKRLFSDTKLGIDFNGLKESVDVQKFFSEYADSSVKYDMLKKMQKILSGRIKKVSFEELFFIEKIIFLIREGVAVEIKDVDIRFALKHLRTVMDWWIPDKHDETYVNIIAAVTVMQELAQIYHTKEKFTYQYNKHDDKKTFSAMIAKPVSADRLAKIVLVNRLHYRFVVNIGGAYAVQNIQKIKSLISELVEVIMLYNNFEDAQMASYFVHTHITDVIKTISEPPNTKEQFESLISSYLTKNISEIKIEDSIYLTKLLHENEVVLKKLAKSIAKEIDTYSVDDLQFISEKNVTNRISVKLFGDTKKGYIKILQLYIICQDYEQKKLKELCLENCIL
ncbi:MAG: hypothetical protein K2J47_10785 [Ruminococcus sp.]|nr:hypothetical protein [Ruminococcus sp.]